MQPRNFFITGLSRSRTKWFSEYFTRGPVFCWHEALNGCLCRHDFYERMSAPLFDVVGNSDSGLFISDFLVRYPESPVVVIERDLEEVRASLTAIGLEPPPGHLESHWNNVSVIPGLHVAYEDINRRLPEIHDYCVGEDFDPDWAEQMIHTVVKDDNIVGNPVSYRLWEGN